MENELTRDAFLGGRLQIWQPAKGYRAGVDPILLAAAVNAKPTDKVLELGCGVGVASLALSQLTGAGLTGIELQPEYSELARRNARENDLPLTVFDGDLRDMPAPVCDLSFDHVIANPPYFDRGRGSVARNSGRELAMGEETPLHEWIDAAVKRLKPKGLLTVIQNAERLVDLLSVCDSRMGDVTLMPISPRVGRNAERIILRAKKGAGGAPQLLPPLVMHKGQHHRDGAGQYTDDVEEVLRNGKALPNMNK